MNAHTLFLLSRNQIRTGASTGWRTPTVSDVEVVSEQYMHAENIPCTLASQKNGPSEMNAHTLFLLSRNQIRTGASTGWRTPTVSDVEVVSEQYMHAENIPCTLASQKNGPSETLIPCFYLAGIKSGQVPVQGAEPRRCLMSRSYQSNICTLSTFRARWQVSRLDPER